MEISDLDSDGPELSCQYIDGVIRRFPETKSTMEYIRIINSQLRYDANGYKEMYQELQSENQGLREEIAKAQAEYKRRTDEVNLLIKKQITDKEEIERLKELIKKKDKYLDQALRQWDMYASNSQENLDESFEMEGVIYREAQEALGLK